MSEPADDYRPTVDDVDPSALAVNSVDPSETEIVDSAGETLRVDEESDGDRVLLPEDAQQAGDPGDPAQSPG
jgi:hypothetical protein